MGAGSRGQTAKSEEQRENRNKRPRASDLRTLPYHLPGAEIQTTDIGGVRWEVPGIRRSLPTCLLFRSHLSPVTSHLF